MKKLAIIGGGVMASIFAKNAREMSVESHCFSLESGISNKSDFDFVHYVNILDHNKVLNICKELCIDGVVATTELTIATTAFVANNLNLIGIDYNVAQNITNKYHNREKTKNVMGLKHPMFCKAFSVEDIKNSSLKFPIILKPTSKGGKRGITVVKSMEYLNDAFNYALTEANGELPIIVEEFIDSGIECSVESLSYKGKPFIIQITEKETSGAPHCVELAHHQPANLPNEIKEKIKCVLSNALIELGVVNGPCHTEIKIIDNDIYLIEFNARPGGDHISYPLVDLSTGYAYIKGAINIALNQFEDVDYSKFLNKCSGVYFITKQTQHLLPIFKNCQDQSWCYKKNYISSDLKDIIHNDGSNGTNLNYMMYVDDKRPKF